MIGIKLDARLGLAVFVSRLMHHVDLLLASYPREMSVITHANQQAAAIGIGKSRYRFCQFAGIGNAIFEVLLLVFAFTNKAEKIVLVMGAKLCKLSEESRSLRQKKRATFRMHAFIIVICGIYFTSSKSAS